MGLTKPRAYQIFDIDYKQAVRVITLANITLAGGAPSSVDGVSLAVNDRILVAGQSTGSQNGLYQVSVLGTGSNGTWIRSVDTNESGELNAGTIVMVTEGTTYKDTQWKLTTNDPIVIGTTALVFEQNSAFAFGNIWANSTAVLADIVGDTVTFTPANNMVILANATTDTITFEVSQSPNFTGNFQVSGTIGSNLIPSANIVYNLGNTTNRWNDIWLSNSTIYLGNAQISANATSLILTNPQGAQTVLSGPVANISAANASIGNLLITGNIFDSGTSLQINTTTAANIALAPNQSIVLTATTTGANITGTLNATGNANVGNVGGTRAVFTNLVGTLETAAQPNITSVGSLTSLTVTGNANAGNVGGTRAVFTNIVGTLETAAQPNITSVGSLTSLTVTGNANVGNLGTAGQLIATGNVTGAVVKATGNIEIQNRGILYLNDSDNSNYIGLRSPAALTGNYIYIFPSSYGNADQVLSTNGSGGLAWVDQTGGGGGGGASQYPNSTVTPLPGSTGNFDLSYDFVQTVQEVPFETSATDPFGVNLGEVYSMMDPVGEILEGVDLGVLT